MNLNISIDDVSPHPLSSTRVLDRCYDLISVFPDIKFTLFVPTAYWRTVREEARTNRPLYLYDHEDFCKTLRSLSKDNFEIGFHGHFHGIPGVSDNDEFKSLSYEEASLKFKEINHVIEASNLKEVFSPIFRPPAWRMSPGSIQAARDFGIQILALSPKEYAKQTYAGAENSFPNVVYFDCNPPFDPLDYRPTTEIVYHACEWDRNYLSKSMCSELASWIQKRRDISYKFMKDLF